MAIRATAVLALVAVAASAGCYTHQCDAQTTHYAGGELVATRDGYAYETSPLQSPKEPWVDFPGQVTLVVTYPASVSAVLAGCTPLGGPEAWLGTSDHPNDDDAAVLTPNAGQTAQFTGVSTTGFTVTNGSCASYSALFVVNFACPPARDAGSD